MKAIVRAYAVCAVLLVLAGCETPPPVPTPPAPQPSAAPRPRAEAEPVAPPPADWRDAPLTKGAWGWHAAPADSPPASSYAEFAAPRRVHVVIACDWPHGRVGIMRIAPAAEAGGLLSVTTSTTRRQITLAPAQNLPGTTTSADLARVGAMLDAGDRLLDALALTRGRFVLEFAGSAPLYLPADTAISRVVEDCRRPRP